MSPHRSFSVPLSSFDPTVQVPAGTQLGDNVMLMRGASLGSGTVLGNGVTIGVNAVVGDNNTLEVGVVVGRGASVGSDNDILEDSVIGRSALIGDNTVFGGELGYAAQLGDILDLPEAIVGSLVMLGSEGASPGDLSCPGPLIVARGSDVASTPGSVFTCTGSVVIGPNTTLESAVLGADVRIRKEVFLGATTTLGDGVRIGREAALEGGVQVNDDARVGPSARLCDTSAAFDGNIARAFVDPTCP